MKDEHQIIKIIEKTPDPKNIGKIVKGDTNSNILTFEINRFYDGEDLYTKNIRFLVNNNSRIFTEEAVNLQYNDKFLRFSWILSYEVTQKSGAIYAAIEFFGTSDVGSYSLKTTPFIIKIEDTIDATEITDEHSKNWFVDIENRLHVIESSLGVTETTFATMQDVRNAIDGAKCDLEEIENLFVQQENSI